MKHSDQVKILNEVIAWKKTKEGKAFSKSVSAFRKVSLKLSNLIKKEFNLPVKKLPTKELNEKLLKMYGEGVHKGIISTEITKESYVKMWKRFLKDADRIVKGK